MIKKSSDLFNFLVEVVKEVITLEYDLLSTLYHDCLEINFAPRSYALLFAGFELHAPSQR